MTAEQLTEMKELCVTAVSGCKAAQVMAGSMPGIDLEPLRVHQAALNLESEIRAVFDEIIQYKPSSEES